MTDQSDLLPPGWHRHHSQWHRLDGLEVWIGLSDSGVLGWFLSFTTMQKGHNPSGRRVFLPAKTHPLFLPAREGPDLTAALQSADRHWPLPEWRGGVEPTSPIEKLAATAEPMPWVRCDQYAL